MYRLLVLPPILLIALGGCPPRNEGPAPEVDATMVQRAQAQWPDADQAQLQRGRDLLFGECAECHARPGPASEPRAAWRGIAERMAEKCGMDADQREALVRYLVAGAP